MLTAHTVYRCRNQRTGSHHVNSSHCIQVQKPDGPGNRVKFHTRWVPEMSTLARHTHPPFPASQTIVVSLLSLLLCHSSISRQLNRTACSHNHFLLCGLFEAGVTRSTCDQHSHYQALLLTPTGTHAHCNPAFEGSGLVRRQL